MLLGRLNPTSPSYVPTSCRSQVDEVGGQIVQKLDEVQEGVERVLYEDVTFDREQILGNRAVLVEEPCGERVDCR